MSDAAAVSRVTRARAGGPDAHLPHLAQQQAK
jgi:hypothetical protein